MIFYSLGIITLLPYLFFFPIPFNKLFLNTQDMMLWYLLCHFPRELQKHMYGFGLKEDMLLVV